MPTICRLLELPPDQATSLTARPGELAHAVASAKIFSDVYRYWDGIQYLLGQHQPALAAVRWLELGQAISPGTKELPGARVIGPADVTTLDAALRGIEPEHLVPHYEAEALDQAEIYPRCWRSWEETFDPLGQLLEHYSFLQSFARNCASAGDALLLYFVVLEDGSV